MEGKLIKLGEDKYDLLVDFDPKVLEGHELSLTNCQAIERGYDLDELADKHINKYYELDDSAKRVSSRLSFKAGFQKALEILGDKKFSAGQLLNAMDLVWQWMNGEDYGCKTLTEVQDKHIQSLQQTEWDVTFDPEEKDVEGRLILKRK